MVQHAHHLEPTTEAEGHPPAATIWPLVSVLGAALLLPGLLHELPEPVRAVLIGAGSLIAVTGIAGWLLDDERAPAIAARWRLLSGRAGPVYEPPAEARRTEKGTARHLKALQDIARARFDFPTPRHKHYKTYLNHPRRAMGVRMPGGSAAYPDIVVVQHPENHTVMLAQVETTETVNEDVAFYEWGPYAELAPLYLFVPVGKGDEALALCRRFNVPVVGIRTWRYVVGYDEMEVSDHYTVPSGPEELLPRLLRPRR